MDETLVERLLETSLYVSDLEQSTRFYQELFGFEKISGDSRFTALSIAGTSVLLLFKKQATLAPVKTPGGVIPPHDGSGNLHLAFGIDRAKLDEWEQRLQTFGLKVTGRVDWPNGGRSLYFDDPDGHVVEIATRGIWKIY
jgi:catechol-2,3-dioxygenase